MRVKKREVKWRKGEEEGKNKYITLFRSLEFTVHFRPKKGKTLVVVNFISPKEYEKVFE